MTTTHPFDDAMSLSEIEKGRFRGATSSEYANMTGPFGGVTAAVLLNAVLQSEDQAHHPVALTVNFCKAMADGEFEITANAQRTGKYTQHWSLELIQEGTICATASVVCGARPEAFNHHASGMPDVPPADACQSHSTERMPSWFQRYDFRYAQGAPAFSRTPFEVPADSKSLLWIEDKPARPLDYLSLAALADCFLLRFVHVIGTLVPAGTVSMTTYFHATPEEIVAQGAGPILGMAEGKRFQSNFHDQHMEIWSRDGLLLATGAQIVWYKA